jgi:malate synthase
MQRDEVVAQLSEVLGAALNEWVRSLSFEELRKMFIADGKTVFVDPDSMLVFDANNRRTDVELWRLRRILTNISKHANYVNDYVIGRGITPIASSTDKQVLRRLVTIRDSSAEMARLLNGEDLDSDEVSDDELTPELVHELAERVPHDRSAPVGDDLVLKLAQVHRQVRFLAAVVRNTEHPEPGPIAQELEKIAKYIRES